MEFQEESIWIPRRKSEVWSFVQKTLFAFTARNSSCRKVMFSQVSVCPQGVGGYTWSQVPSEGRGGYVRGVYPGGGYTRGMLGIPEGGYTRGQGVGMYTPQDTGPGVSTHPPPLLTLSGLMVTTTAHTVGKRAIRILLECCLVTVLNKVEAR